MLEEFCGSTLIYPQRERDLGTRRHLYRAARRGELLRLAPGAYVIREDWAALDVDAQYRLRIRAAWSRASPVDVLSHWSAAALWQLPIIGSWPETVHVVGRTASGGRSTAALRRHIDPWGPEAVHVNGMRVTPLAQTVVDLARVGTFAAAVAMGDAALWRAAHPRDAGQRAGVTGEELESVFSLLGERKGFARARRVLDFIDGRANGPGESLSRVTMESLGVPLPELQHVIFGPTGRRYELDFYWPEWNIGAEFDGRVKYSDPRYLRGRTAEQVVYDEKVREDEIRPLLAGFGRWDFRVAGSSTLLSERLRRIGVRW